MWIVTGSKEDLITLVSSRKVDGILPVGSYLTVSDGDTKHILLVEESQQTSLFAPSPLVVDEELPFLEQDQECKNEVRARAIRQVPLRSDGLFSFVKPSQQARRTTQDEINEMFDSGEGYPVFLATNYRGQNAPLKDDSETLISVRIPFDSLYLQTMIAGQTGSGKTVAMKYLMDEFLQHERGAVLAINVKSTDLLTMDQPTTITNPQLEKQTRAEWDALGLNGMDRGEFSIYVPASRQKHKQGVTPEKVIKITLRTRDLEPNSLLGVLQNITDRAAEALPSIFRYWKERFPEQTDSFLNFIEWFRNNGTRENQYLFPTISQAGEESRIPLHPGTFNAILRSLETAIDFFDSTEEDCVALREDNIMVQGKLSIIDLSNKDTLIFGAVLLRHLISRIYDAKAVKGQFGDLPVLIVIDEVHHFYKSTASTQALEELNAIARMGRSEKIGVVFASQNPQDLPEGLTSIVNTRIFFRSLEHIGRKFDVRGSPTELSSLANGYAVMSNVALPQVRLVKFPIPLLGVKS